MFKRIFRSFVQLVSVVALGFAVLFGVLFWRLTAGPISLSFLTPYFEAAFQVSDNSFEIKLENTVLTWVGREQNLGIKLQGIKAIAVDGKVIAEVPELAITLSGAALLQGQIAPRNITIFGPNLNIVRTEVGRLELELAQYMGDSNLGGSSNQDLLGRIIGELFSPADTSQPLGYLRRVDIINADVTIDDRQLDVEWKAPKTTVTLIRKEYNVYVSAELALKSTNVLVRKTAAINLSGDYNLDKKEARITVGFSDLNPVVFAPISPKLEALKNFDLPLSGTVDLVVLRGGEIEKFKFNLSSGKGKIAFVEPVRASVIVKEIKFLGEYDKTMGRLQIEDLTLNLDKDGALTLPRPFNHKLAARKISLVGNYDFDFNRLTIQEINLLTKELTLTASATVQRFDDKISFELDGEARGFSIHQMSTVWPKGQAVFARKWMTENLADGIISSAKANMTGRYSKKNGLEVTTILGVMDYQNMTVDYFPPMPKATDGKGRIKFDRKRVDIEIKHGKLGDLLIRNGRITFTDLDKDDQYVDVQLEIDGSLESVVKFSDSKPFEFLKSVDFTPTLINGSFSSKVNLNFLLERDITSDKVKVFTQAVLKNVEISKIALDLDLTKANLIFNADNKGMTIKGAGQLSGVKTEIEWHEDFTQLGRYRRKYSLKSVIDDRFWREKLKFNFPPFNKTYINGVMGVDVKVMVNNDGLGELEAELDLKDALITLPRMGWYKPEKVAAVASVIAAFANGKFISIPKVAYSGGGLKVDANASFKKSGKLNQVVIGRLEFGQTDVKAIIAPHSDPKNDGWNIHVSGKQLDLIEWMTSEDVATEKVRGVPLKFSLNLESIQLYPNRNLTDVNGIISFDGWVWDNAFLKAGRGLNKALDIKLESKNGRRSLNIEANNAGSILKIFDYYDNLIGGKLMLRGKYDGMLPESKFSGHVRIDDFRIIKAPILANLLSLASITGIVDELIGGVGIGFRRLVAPFESKDDVITIKDASVSGVSLGMTATGNIDSSGETIDVKGTIVPAYFFNTALTRIPIIGTLLSGGEKHGGVFAANYTMTGNLKEPDISTNPLSVLAPGFLRKLFSIFDGSTKEITKN